MKRKLRFLAGACLFTATALFSGCSSDDDFLMDPVDSGTSQTRAVTNSDGTLTITFDDFDPGMLAGPTSAGENLYSYQGYPQVTTIYDNTPEEYLFLSMFNTVGGSTEYSSGGIALSNWNIRSNQSGNTGDWWYSYLNQCSVYNTAVKKQNKKVWAQRFHLFSVSFTDMWMFTIRHGWLNQNFCSMLPEIGRPVDLQHLIHLWCHYLS